jgi:feruloyl esterase
VESAFAVYNGLFDDWSGELLYHGLERGSEASWAPELTGPMSNPPRGASWAKWALFKDPLWSWSLFDFRYGYDLNAYFTRNGASASLLNPGVDLRDFYARGGKIIQYHGWADNDMAPPRLTLAYYDQATALANDGHLPPGAYTNLQPSHRLFMAPGMSHCYDPAAKGPNTFDMMTAIEDWVEKGIAPDRIVASHMTGGVVDRARPLCPYPAVARWTGRGSIDDAANFVCAEVR